MAITCMTSISHWGLLIVGSADACVTLYDLTSVSFNSQGADVIGRFPMEYIPTSVLFHISQRLNSQANGPMSTMAQKQSKLLIYHSKLVIGDSQGNIHLFYIHPEFGMQTEVSNKKKNQSLFQQSIKDHYKKIKISQSSDWITGLIYATDLNVLLIASNDKFIYYYDIEKEQISKVFQGHKKIGSTLPAKLSKTNNNQVNIIDYNNNNTNSNKNNSKSQTPNENEKEYNKEIFGISAIAWSSFAKYIASSSDKTMLLWDPFTMEIMNRINIFTSPVASIIISDSQNKLFVTTTNKNIYIWHSVTMELLQTVTDYTFYKPSNLISSCHFISELGYFISAGNRLSLWKLEKFSDDRGEVIEEDIISVLYNSSTCHIIIVKSLGTLRIFHAGTGEIVRQFLVSPIDPKTSRPMKPLRDQLTGIFKPIVIHACLDCNQNRVIITGPDQRIYFWNLHDGNCLFQFDPQLYSTTLAHLYFNIPKNITHIFQGQIYSQTSDENDDSDPISFSTSPQKQSIKPVKTLFISTDHGHVCIYPEIQATIEEVPSSFLRISEIQDPLITTHKKKLSFEEENFDDDKPLVPIIDHTLENESVLWSSLFPQTNNLFVSYSSGKLALWDIKKTYLKPFEFSIQSNGVIFGKNEKNNEKINEKNVEKLSDKNKEGNINFSKENKVETVNSLIEGNFTDLSQNEAKKDNKQPIVKKRFSRFVGNNNTNNSNINTNDSIKDSKSIAGRISSFQKDNDKPKPSDIISNNDIEIKISNWDESDVENEIENEENNDRLIEENNEEIDNFHKVSAHNSILDELDSINPSNVNSNQKMMLMMLQSSSRKDTATISIRKHSVISTSQTKPTIPQAPIVENIKKPFSRGFSRGKNRKNLQQQQIEETSKENEESGENESNNIVIEEEPIQEIVEIKKKIHSARRWTIKLNSNTSFQDKNIINGTNSVFETNSIIEEDLTVNDGKQKKGNNSRPNSKINTRILPTPPTTLVRTASPSSRSTAISSSNDFVLENSRTITAETSISDNNFSSLITNNNYEQPILEMNEVPISPTKTLSLEIQNSPVTVDCAVILPNLQILIGACSDKILRFWDLESKIVLCSFNYTKNLEESEDAQFHIEEVLRILKVSENEDILVGAYSSGVVKVWSIQAYSFLTLRSMLKKHMESGSKKEFGIGLNMAISPVSLIKQWTAHDCPILCMEYIFIEDEESKNDQNKENKLGDMMGHILLEGFVVTAGLDQRVFLWDIRGKSIGEFGVQVWDLNNELTWREKLLLIVAGKQVSNNSSKNNYKKKKFNRNNNLTNNSVDDSYIRNPQPPTSIKASKNSILTARSITQENIQIKESPSTSLIKNLIHDPQPHNTQAMNNYVKILTKKVNNRTPIYQDIDDQFFSIIKNHPIESVKLKK